MSGRKITELKEVEMNQGPELAEGLDLRNGRARKRKPLTLSNVTLQPLKLPPVSSLLPFSLFLILPQFFFFTRWGHFCFEGHCYEKTWEEKAKALWSSEDGVTRCRLGTAGDSGQDMQKQRRRRPGGNPDQSDSTSKGPLQPNVCLPWVGVFPPTTTILPHWAAFTITGLSGTVTWRCTCGGPVRKM